MWICHNCEEPNSISGQNCPYCNYKGNNFKQEIFIIKNNLVKSIIKETDNICKRLKKDRWIDRIPDEIWNCLKHFEADFLLEIQKEIDKIKKE